MVCRLTKSGLLMWVLEARGTPRADRSGRPSRTRAHFVPLALQPVHSVDEGVNLFQGR